MLLLHRNKASNNEASYYTTKTSEPKVQTAGNRRTEKDYFELPILKVMQSSSSRDYKLEMSVTDSF